MYESRQTLLSNGCIQDGFIRIMKNRQTMLLIRLPGWFHTLLFVGFGRRRIWEIYLNEGVSPKGSWMGLTALGLLHMCMARENLPKNVFSYGLTRLQEIAWYRPKHSLLIACNMLPAFSWWSSEICSTKHGMNLEYSITSLGKHT